ncbi:MAG: hypothetical protein J7K66_00050 [Anaerolineaceae bacterium]|nr:hypothetical protein [Anaerolineaceae bacterium]
MKIKESTNNLSTEDLKKSDAQEKQGTENKPGQKNTFLRTTINKVGFALLFLFIGALIVGLFLYLPSASALKKAQSELDQLMPIETEYIALQEDNQIANTRSSVYKILSNASFLAIALKDNNTSRINQYILYIEEDLDNLNVSKFPDLPSELSAQFSKVKSYTVDNRLKAISELQSFHNDLLLLIDNLK